MKKFLLCAISAVAMLFCASCSNEDIEIGTEVSIKVVPESVIDGLSQIELNSGDMNNLGNYRLRVRVMVYSENGSLATLQESITDSYSKVVNFTPKLANGTYTVITVADNIQLNTDNSIKLRFWHLEDSTNLSTVKVRHAGYIGNQRSIVAAAKQTFTVSQSNKSITLSPVRMGSMIVNLFYDYAGMYNKTRQPEISTFGLLSKKSCDYFAPASGNAFDYSFRTKEWLIVGSAVPKAINDTYIETDGSRVAFTYGYASCYSFLFPSSTSLYTLGIKKNTKDNWTYWSSGKTTNLDKSKSYVFDVEYYGDLYGDGDVYASYALKTIDEWLKDKNTRTTRGFSMLNPNVRKIKPEPGYMLFTGTETLKLADI